MPSLWERIKTDDLWTLEVPLDPPLFATRLSAHIATGDPDNISFAEASMIHKKPLVGKLNESGFRVRERFGWIGSNRSYPVAWASFSPTSKGTRVECHFPGTGAMRSVFVFVLAPLLMFFVAMGLHTLSKNGDLGGFMLLATGLLSLLVAAFYWSFRSTVGELKDEIREAMRRSVFGPVRRSHPRR